MGLWRCQNLKCSEDVHGRCIFDFEAAKPICPKCGTNGKTRPGTIIKRECIHFDEPTDTVVNGVQRGKNTAACTGLPFKGMATGEAPCVTCPKCMETLAYKKALAAFSGEVYSEGDFPLAVDLKGQVFKEEGA
jgi:hypothetical protein